MDAELAREVWDRLAARDPHGALAILDGVGSRGARDAEVSYLRSVAHFRLGDFAAAEDHARNAVSLNTSHAAAFYYLGLSVERQGRLDEAFGAYRVVLALDPSHQKAREKLGAQGAPAAPAPARQQNPSRQQATEFTLPTSDEEFEVYERTIRRKALIDARAEYNAQLRGMPGWVKVAMWIVSLMILAIFAWVIYGFIRVGGPPQPQGEMHQQVCEQAAQQGVELADC